MKKLLVSALLATTALGAMTTANAGFNPTEIRPYVGVDYKYMEGFDDGALKGLVEDQTSMLGVTAGIQFNDYIGFEVSYAESIKNLSKGVTTTATGQFTDPADPTIVYDVTASDRLNDLDFSHFTAGVTAQYPLSDNIYAKALLGASWQKMEASGVVSATASTVDPATGQTISASDSASVSASDSENGVLLAKVGVGYQMSKNSIVEVNYTREDNFNGLGLQYKFVF